MLEKIYYGLCEERQDTQEVKESYDTLIEFVERYFGTLSTQYEEIYDKIHDYRLAESFQAFKQGVSWGMGIVRELQE